MTEELSPAPPGQQVGKYRLVQLLGRGTSGTVYRAVDTFTGKEVALKIVDPEIFRDPDFGDERHAQFLSEASLAGMLIHPHVVTLLDAVVQKDTAHIAMELVTGGDLSQYVVPGSLLPVAEVLEICFHCCGALDYTSRAGIIHCDIKPRNIMIAEGTDIRITDFGAAVLHKSRVVRDMVLGSPHYVSPERLAGEEPTFHSDMYSLGVVMYELLSGHRPFVADNIEDLVRTILTHEPAPPSSLRPELPPRIDRIVMRAMRKKPEERYRNWAEFAFELSEASRHILPSEAVSESEKLSAFKRIEALAGLSDAELSDLARAARWSRVKPEEVIVREGDPGSHFFLLAAGSAKVILRERLLNLVNAGEFFGEMSYLLGAQQPRSATVVATRDSLVAEFAPEALARMSPEGQLVLVRILARSLAERLALANTRLAG